MFTKMYKTVYSPFALTFLTSNSEPFLEELGKIELFPNKGGMLGDILVLLGNKHTTYIIVF
jgi:hypothetical protein